MSFGQAIHIGNYFQINFKPLPKIVQAVKALPERRFDYNTKIWVVPVRYRDEVERFCKQHQIEFGAKIVQEEERDFDIPPLPELEIDIPLKMEMRPYQKQGVAYNIQRQRVIMGDDMGLGKTVQAIATISGLNRLRKDSFPCLVICPSAVKENWKREIEKWSNHKAIILRTSVKDTFPEYYRTGMAQFFIVNYESLKKYFVSHIDDPGTDKNGRKKPLRLNHIHFKEKYINFFKAVIADESHKCFPYNTRILTNKGWLQIGEIVENNMLDLSVASCDLSNNSVTYNKINNLFRNELSGRKIYCVKHSGGRFYATENHKVYTVAGQYKEVREIKSGEGLYLLRSHIHDTDLRPENSKVLLEELRRKGYKFQSGNTCKDGQEQKGRTRSKGMRLVQSAVQHSSRRQKKVLRKILFSSMENVKIGVCKEPRYAGKTCKVEGICYQADGESGISSNAFRENDFKQSNEVRKNQRKGIKGVKGTAVSRRKRGKWRAYKATVATKQGFGVVRLEHGVSHPNCTGPSSFRQNSDYIQIRHRNSRNHAFNRSGRLFTQSIESESGGRIENESLELVRVESCEVYQSGSDEQFEAGYRNREFVYDIEVDVNHNYFAEGVLVSNCKSLKTLATKLTKGICTGKETILLLTGTPVINKPKDLIAPLGILSRLSEFNGYKEFEKRYCSGPKEASNLKELNYRLNVSCFYRRNKTDPDIKKLLPDKMRQYIMCDLDKEHRKEYGHAQANLESYLSQYKGQSDEQIKKSMKGQVMVTIGILKNISAKGKLGDAFNFIGNLIEQGEKVVVFANLTEIIDKVQEKFPKSVRVTGRENDKQKQSAVDRFQSDPSINLIALNLKAGGVGIDGLQNVASQICFIEFGWHAAIMDQAEDRLFRSGQHRNVMCTYFLGKDTIDNWNYKLIESKRDIANTVVGAQDETEVNIIDDIINLFTKP